jgi:DNA modification methylase
MPPSKHSPERQEPRSSGRSVPNNPAPKPLTPTTKPVTLLHGDVLTQLQRLPTESVHCCITSPPYWGLRDYGVTGQLGLERTPEEYVRKMVAVFREVRRVLRQDGTLWLVIGDSYSGGFGQGSPGNKSKSNVGSFEGRVAIKRPNGYKNKDLVGIPWLLAFALRADGWYLRQDIIWSKTNPMPESVTDRCCKSHEHIFLLTKSKHYYFDHEAIKEPAAQAPAAQAPAAQALGTPRLTGQHKANAGGFTHNGTGLSTLGSNQGAETRTKRDVWRISTQPYKEAHFATFPEELVTLCILAGVSAKRCEQCSAPWVRVMRRTSQPKRAERNIPGDKDANSVPRTQRGLNLGTRDEKLHSVQAPTTMDSWRPTCKCPRTQGTGPAVILDPFCGSGTVGAVARRYGLSFVGIDLNPEYLSMARRRISKAEAAR